MIRFLIPGLPMLLAHAFAGLSLLWLQLVIVPSYINIFDNLEVDLPTASQWLIASSDMTIQYWYILIPLLGILDLVAVVVLQQFKERGRWMLWAWFGFWLFLAVVFQSFAATALYVPMNQIITKLG